MGLASLHGDRLIHVGAHRDLVHEPAVHTGDRNGSALLAGHDYLAQHDRTVGFDAGHLLGTVVGVHSTVA